MASSYRTALIRETTDALKNTFDSTFPEVGLRNIYVGPELQYERASYPQIYIVFQENLLRNMGLGHHVVSESDETGEDTRYLQWYYQGAMTFNCLAMTSQGRDELADNLLNVIAFGREHPSYRKFHDDIYDNDWILMYLMTDDIQAGGVNTLSAPWGTSDELIYHAQYSVALTGEFFSDPYAASLVRISTILPYPYRPDQPVPQGSQLPADINEPWVG